MFNFSESRFTIQFRYCITFFNFFRMVLTTVSRVDDYAARVAYRFEGQDMLSFFCANRKIRRMICQDMSTVAPIVDLQGSQPFFHTTISRTCIFVEFAPSLSTSLLDYYGSILLPYTTSSGYKSTIYRCSQQRWRTDLWWREIFALSIVTQFSTDLQLYTAKIMHSEIFAIIDIC